MKQTSNFGTRLGALRQRRGLSQLQLAGMADISQRHLSFLESGRTMPSREMILRLSLALDLSLRLQNVLLLAVGFAPVWRESDLTAPELAEVNAALGFMLAQQEPFPAVVVDRCWNVLNANGAAGRLVDFVSNPTAKAATDSGPVNLADSLISPDGMRKYLVNWPEVALYFLRGVQADSLADGSEETAALLARLLSYAGVPSLVGSIGVDESAGPVLTMHFKRDDVSLRLFTTIATLGTPHDVTLQEIRIESFFPADDETAAWFRAGH